ncbi:MAG TPA: phosphatidylglycerol lysyltransferase domain-containing protein, partial [Acetobacteraceae bacterium]
VMAVGLAQRVSLAWALSLALLLTAAGYTAAQGEALWIPLLLSLAALSIAPFHRTFYRSARLFSTRLQPGTVIPLLLLAGSILALSALGKQVRWLADDSWWAVILSPDVPNAVRSSVAVMVLVGVVSLWGLLRPGHVHPASWDGAARATYAALGAVPPARADGVVWGEAGRAGIAFRRIGRVLLGLGDPVGAPSDRASAIWRLNDLARQERRDPAFWRAGPDLLPIYADLGLAALPLDQDGLPRADSEDSLIPHASHFLVCLAERDLPELLPLLPQLAEKAAPQSIDRPSAAVRR